MRWITDRTGRFDRRPYYESLEMESDCEDVVAAFLLRTHGSIQYPISTDDLTLLLEQHADLDLYADLRSEGDDVEGMTTFCAGRRPFVQIDERLTVDARRHNRLRTTLAHEFGHVRLHNILFQNERGAVPLFGDGARGEQRCRRDGIRSAPTADWMEYQAYYVCGALLAPKRKILELARKITKSTAPVAPGSEADQRCSLAVAEAFQISVDAARVRLRIAGVVGDARQTGLSLG